MQLRTTDTPTASGTLTRRRVVAGLTGIGLVSMLGAGLRPALASTTEPLERTLEEALNSVVSGAEATDGRIKLELPEIAENGNTVPLKFSVESPMTADDHVKAVHVFAEGNPLPDVASFHFTPRSGKAHAATRIRLAQTQNVIALAEMSDGSVFRASRQVKVTIGGCGG